MTTNKRIIEYYLAPIREIQQRLSEGFQPYGSPFLYKDQQNSTQIYQALIKSNPDSSTKIPKKALLHPLSKIEQQCIAGLMADYNYTNIAKTVYRSPRTVRNIIGKLRQKWKCQTNVGLILTIQEQNIIEEKGI